MEILSAACKKGERGCVLMPLICFQQDPGSGQCSLHIEEFQGASKLRHLCPSAGLKCPVLPLVRSNEQQIGGEICWIHFCGSETSIQERTLLMLKQSEVRLWSPTHFFSSTYPVIRLLSHQPATRLHGRRAKFTQN